MTRRELREHTFLLLFREEFHAPWEMEEQLSFYFDGMDPTPDGGGGKKYRMPIAPQGEDAELTKKRYQDVISHKEEIDAQLSSSISGWKLGRVGKVELAILRLAVYEMRYDEEIPEKVAMNEAVELAKKFGAEQASGFVNGVLAKLATEKNAEEK